MKLNKKIRSLWHLKISFGNKITFLLMLSFRSSKDMKTFCEWFPELFEKKKKLRETRIFCGFATALNSILIYSVMHAWCRRHALQPPPFGQGCWPGQFAIPSLSLFCCLGTIFFPSFHRGRTNVFTPFARPLWRFNSPSLWVCLMQFLGEIDGIQQAHLAAGIALQMRPNWRQSTKLFN